MKIKYFAVLLIILFLIFIISCKTYNSQLDETIVINKEIEEVAVETKEEISKEPVEEKSKGLEKQKKLAYPNRKKKRIAKIQPLGVTLEELNSEIEKFSAEEENQIEEIVDTVRSIESLVREVWSFGEKIEIIESELIDLHSEVFDLLNNLQKREQLLGNVKQERKEMQAYTNAVDERIAEIQPLGVTLVGEWKMVATAAYAAEDAINALGLKARKGIIAVDPRVILLRTMVFIDGYGVAIAADTGSWIKGDRINLYFESIEECEEFGRRTIYVYLVD